MLNHFRYIKNYLQPIKVTGSAVHISSFSGSQKKRKKLATETITRSLVFKDSETQKLSPFEVIVPYKIENKEPYQNYNGNNY